MEYTKSVNALIGGFRRLIFVGVRKQDGVAPLIEDPTEGNSTTDTDTHLLSDRGDTCSFL